MKIEKQNNTYKKLILLIAIFLFGFISLFSLNKIFMNLVTQLDQETNNLKAKITIGEFISYDILKVRALFHELATTTTSQRSRDMVIGKIKKTIDTINHSLDVLEHGGTLKRVIALNIAGHQDTIKKVKYVVKNKDSFSLEVIDIKPKLLELLSMTQYINKLLSTRDHLKKAKNVKGFLKAAKKVRRYYKTLPAYFTRISENIGRLLYEGEIDLKKLEIKIEADKNKYMQMKLYLIFFVILLVVVLGYKIIKTVENDSKKLYELNLSLNETLANQQKQERSIRAILDAQSNIILVSNGTQMIDANRQLIVFFDKYKSFEEFKADNDCICDFFEENVPNDEYIVKKDYDGLNWSDYIMANPEKSFKVIMKKNGIKHHFLIQATKTVIDDYTGEAVMIITLNDITKEVNTQIKLASLNNNLELMVKNKTKELQELNENLEQKIIIETQKVRDKDKQMAQQARSAAMGEMIGNIAHQWRQPLSAINTTASGMQLQMQLGIATNEEISESYSKIMGYVDFLTQTIEDFRGFFREDKEKTVFNIVDTITKTLSVTSASYKDNDIHLINKTTGMELISFGMPSELSQVFLNILNNAKDALISNKIEHKYVQISCQKTDNENIVYIHDNAGGIPDHIIEKIFDPYFTTKHQSQGTGIGLYMSKEIVEKHMRGNLSVKNKDIDIEGTIYTGACFKISLPISKA